MSEALTLRPPHGNVKAKYPRQRYIKNQNFPVYKKNAFLRDRNNNHCLHQTTNNNQSQQQSSTHDNGKHNIHYYIEIDAIH